MKALKKILLPFILLITYVASNDKPKTKNNNSKQSSYLFSSVSSFVSSSSDGNNERHQNMRYNEEYKEKLGDQPEEVRKYEESFHEDNDEPAEIKKFAESNVEEERKIFGAQPFKQMLSHDLTDDYFKNFFSDFQSFRHGKYDKFLNNKKSNLIKSVTRRNKNK
jgi:hypothetical protein